MTHEQVVWSLIHAYQQTLPDDPSLAESDFAGFCRWAWSDDEPLRNYAIDRDEYLECLREAYRFLHG